MKIKVFEKAVSKRYNFLSLDMDDNFFGDMYYSTHYNEDMNLPGHKLKFYATGARLISLPLNANNLQQETLLLKKGTSLTKIHLRIPISGRSNLLY